MEKKMTQVEYDLELAKLREERDLEYRKIDQRRVINAQRFEFLLNQRKDIVVKMNECKTENAAIEAEKNDIARRFNEKLIALRKVRNESIIPNKEIPSNVAYRLHAAVEESLSKALGKYPDIDIANIKCNWNFAEDGTISFDVQIPEYGREEE